MYVLLMSSFFMLKRLLVKRAKPLLQAPRHELWLTLQIL
jgi:hypothetical protein